MSTLSIDIVVDDLLNIFKKGTPGLCYRNVIFVLLSNFHMYRLLQYNKEVIDLYVKCVDLNSGVTRYILHYLCLLDKFGLRASSSTLRPLVTILSSSLLILSSPFFPITSCSGNLLNVLAHVAELFIYSKLVIMLYDCVKNGTNRSRCKQRLVLLHTQM